MKSSAIAKLPNCLAVDLENGGYDYIDAERVTINSVKELKELCNELIKAGKPYKFIALDSISRLEDMVKPLALKLFTNTPAGANFTGDDILDASHGAGYGYLRRALEICIEMVAKCCQNIILVCHSKDAAVGSSELTIKQISLLGKSPSVLASKSDAIGWLTRDENSNTIVSFNTNNSDIEVGARPVHLRNAEIVLGEMQKNGEVEYHWERIFPSLNKK